MNPNYSGYSGLPGLDSPPLYPSFLRAYRIWRVGESDHLLSPLRGNVWEPGKNTATCFVSGLWDTRDAHPHVNLWEKYCSCGFYAAHEAIVLQDLIATSTSTVIGSVKASGRISIGRLGIRAEHMEVEAIAAHMEVEAIAATPAYFYGTRELSRETVNRVTWAYGVPAFRSIQELLCEFPPSGIVQELTAGGVGC